MTKINRTRDPSRRLGDRPVSISVTALSKIQTLRRDLLEHKYGPNGDTFTEAGQRALNSATRELLSHGLNLSEAARVGLMAEAVVTHAALPVADCAPAGSGQRWAAISPSQRREIARYWKAQAIARVALSEAAENAKERP